MAGLLLTTAMTLALAGCGSDESDSGLEEVKLVLPTPAGIPHTPYFVAEELGYYEEEGLTVDLVNVTGGQDANRVVVTGEGDFAFPAPSSLITAVDGGLPLTSVYAHRQQWIFGFSALKDSGLASMADLEGETVGVISESAATIVQLMLAGSDVDADAVDIQVVGADMAGPLVSGKVDAIYSWTTLFEQYERQGIEQTWIDSPKLDGYQSNVLAASQELVEGDPELVEGFLRATTKGMVFTETNPEAALGILLDEMPELREDEQAAMEELEIAIAEQRSDLTEQHGFGWQTDTSWEQQQDVLDQLELIEEAREPADYFSNDFVEAANDFDHDAIADEATSYEK